MNTDAPKAVFPWVTLSFTAVLLLLAPYAMSFVPFEGIYKFGTYRAPYESDPLNTQRVLVIAFGLSASAISAIEIFVVILRRPGLPSILRSVVRLFGRGMAIVSVLGDWSLCCMFRSRAMDGPRPERFDSDDVDRGYVAFECLVPLSRCCSRDHRRHRW
jgi:hypothetical protein